MIFIETPVFTQDIHALMPDDLYAALQKHLSRHLDDGDVIVGTGGIRKIRWKLPGTGKSGGACIIYFRRVAEDQILMLLAYKKARQDDLSPSQKRVLRQIVENW